MAVNGNHKGGKELLKSLQQALMPFNGIGADLDFETKHAMIQELQKTSESLENTGDLMMRLSETGRVLSFTRIAISLKIFDQLTAACPEALSVDQLSKPTGADPVFVGRVCRWVAACRYITEVDTDTYKANRVTHSLAEPGLAGGLLIFQEAHNLADQILPEVLEESGFQNPTSGVWRRAANTELEFWPWLKKEKPELIKGFHHLMAMSRKSKWFDFEPNPFEIEGLGSSGRTVLVDIGGSFGQETLRVLEKHPELAGRLVCQDLPEVIDQMDKTGTSGIEFLAHDFFEPQPIKDAHYYYLRNILHNWHDEPAVKILKGVASAMAPDSRVLLDEMVIPNRGVNLFAASLDLQMMAMFGSMERTEDQWHALVNRAGLRIVEFKEYSSVMKNTVIIAELK